MNTTRYNALLREDQAENVNRDFYRPTAHSNTALHPIRKRKSQRMQRMSTYTAVCLLLTYIVTPGVVAFLVFLWSNPSGGNVNRNWRAIVTSDWTIKAITISSLIIRSAVSVQATIATSMAAALLLECYQIPVHVSAPVSVFRYVNGGPYDLVFAMFGSMRRKELLMFALLLLLTTTFLLQFTSTVLATDLGYGDLVTLRTVDPGPIGISLNNNYIAMRDSYVDFWAAQPPDFPTFAESIDPQPADKQIDGVRDIGTTIRAFLPISNSTSRTTVEKFEGMATILDSRVVCVRPAVDPSLSLGYSTELGYIVNGTIRPVAVPPGIINYSPDIEWIGRADPGISDTNNSITLAVTDETSGMISQVFLTRPQRVPYSVAQSKWPIIQRSLSTEAPALVSCLDPRYPTVVSSNSSHYYANNTGLLYYGDNFDLTSGNLTFGIFNDTAPLITGRNYLLFNMSSVSADISMLQKGAAESSTEFFFSQQPQDPNRVVLINDSEWLSFEIPRIPGLRISATLCFDSIVSFNANVTVKSDGVIQEPSMKVINATIQDFSTEDLRVQLGTHSGVSQNSSRRGVMTLLNTTEELRQQLVPWYNQAKTIKRDGISWPFQNFVYQKIRSTFAHGITMCAECDENWPAPMPNTWQSVNDGIQSALFQDTLLDTRDTAHALQAYYTSIARTAYYSLFYHFDIQDQPSISGFKAYQFPRTAGGLLAVLIVLSVHMVLVGFLTVIFFSRTEASCIGDNAWQSIAQVVFGSEDMQEVLRSSTAMKDKEIKKTIGEIGLGKDVVHLVSLHPIGNTELYRVGPYGLVSRRGLDK